MNLYKIIFKHYSSDNDEIGIKAMLLAENDEQVYNWISSEPKINDEKLYNNWKDKERNKDKILSSNGEIAFEDEYCDDFQFGITLYGWELLKENINSDYTELIELGVVFTTVS